MSLIQTAIIFPLSEEGKQILVLNSFVIPFTRLRKLNKVFSQMCEEGVEVSYVKTGSVVVQFSSVTLSGKTETIQKYRPQIQKLIRN